jgi:hypothetical protein
MRPVPESLCEAASVAAAGGLHPVAASTLAWHHSLEFWVETGQTIAHHWLAVLICAAVPAAERAYVLARGAALKRGQLGLLELLVTLWRVLLCVVVVWAACTGNEWRQLSSKIGAVGAWQVALGYLGVHVAHHVRMLVWELLFFAIALVLASVLLRLLVQAGARSSAWLQGKPHRQATLSALTNLILVPAAAIYVVEMARPLFH